MGGGAIAPLPSPLATLLRVCVRIDGLIGASLSSYHEESDGALCFGRIRTRLGVDHFPSFPVDVLTSSYVNLLLVRSHQAEIIIVKRLIQGRNNVTRVRVELMILRVVVKTTPLPIRPRCEEG